MPNIHGLSSLRNDNRSAPSNSDSDDENNRYVGGVSSRGGGSGLAVLPNHETGNAASDSIFNLAESNDASSSNNTNDNSQPLRRMITMYRSGFTVDNGPHRRLDDPSNAEFLGSLARGLIPRELREESDGDEGGEVMVGLVDRRGEEYDEERHGAESASMPGSSSGGGFQSFSGEGQSLVDSSAATTSSDAPGVINPSGMSPPAALDDSQPTTSIAVRLLNGKRLVIKINLDATVATLGSFIVAQSALEESFVMTSGYPPAVMEDLSVSVEEAGLKGAQVVLKRA